MYQNNRPVASPVTGPTFATYFLTLQNRTYKNQPTFQKNPPSSAYLDHLGLIPQDPQVSDDKQNSKKNKKKIRFLLQFSVLKNICLELTTFGLAPTLV